MKKAVSNFEAAFLFLKYGRPAYRQAGLPTFLVGVPRSWRVGFFAAIRHCERSVAIC
jgi:hypothetical protein